MVLKYADEISTQVRNEKILSTRVDDDMVRMACILSTFDRSNCTRSRMQYLDWGIEGASIREHGYRDRRSVAVFVRMRGYRNVGRSPY